MKLILKNGEEIDNYLRIVALVKRVSKIKYNDKVDAEEVIDFIEEIMEDEMAAKDEDDAEGSEE